MRFGCGYPMGPLALLDLIGLDTAYEILDTMYKQGRDRLHAPSPIIKQMVSAGLLGRKTGRGFYTYAGPGSPQVVADAQTPGRTAAAPACRCGRCVGRRRRLGHDGDRHHRGVREGRVRRDLRRPRRREGRRRARRAGGRWTSAVRRERPDAAEDARGGARPGDRRDRARGPRRRRPRRRGRSPRTWPSSRTLFRDLDGLQARRDPRHDHLVAAGHRLRHGHVAARRTSSGCTSSTRRR